MKKGALTQVTAGSILGDFGKKIKRFTKQLIDANLVHFIASDAHVSGGGKRVFKLRSAYNDIEKEYGKEVLDYFQENAELVASGKSVIGDIPQRVKKKRFGVL